MYQIIRPTLVATIAIAAFASMECATAHSAQKPVKEQTTYPSFIAPASTLNETVLSTDMVLRGRVVGSGPQDKAHVRNRGTWIRIGHRVKVLEVFRAPVGSDLQGDQITVLQSGGDRDRGTHIDRLTTHGFPQLQPGKEYVLFLAKAEGGTWGSAYGPDGVFAKAGDRVIPFGKSEVAVRQGKQTWTDFLQVLRNFGIQRGGH